MKQIVLVDDNLLFLSKLEDFFKQKNDFECIAFSNPEFALEYVLNEPEIHAVISDFEMPKMTGLTLAKEVLAKRPEIRLLIMSSHSTNYLKNVALKAGITQNSIQFLCKSFLNELFSLLNN